MIHCEKKKNCYNKKKKTHRGYMQQRATGWNQTHITAVDLTSVYGVVEL